MIPQSFNYSAPESLREALVLLEGSDTKVLAGGQSLIPLMKLRLATPGELIDLSRVPELKNVSEVKGTVHIGAMKTHHEIESSAVIRANCPLLAETAGHIGDVQVRNLGTIGGAVAHADPAADYPAALLALEAQIRTASSSAGRIILAGDFFLDAFTTALDPGEIVVEVQVPVEPKNEGFAYEKVPHPASGFAVVGVAARIQKTGDRISYARIAVTGMAGHAFRAMDAEKMLEDGAPVADAVAKIGEGETANSDLFASAEYRLHLTRVHAARAIHRALSRAS